MKFLLIFLGGGLGSTLRYLMAGWVHTRATGPLPLGTMTVNLLGCLAIGLLNGAFMGSGLNVRPEYHAALTLGVLGGFTTFSALGWETFSLLERGAIAPAVVYAGITFAGGLLAVWIGTRIAAIILAP